MLPYKVGASVSTIKFYWSVTPSAVMSVLLRNVLAIRRFTQNIEARVYAEITKTFTCEDVKLFSELTSDTNPLHLDKAFASNTKFQKPIIHGTLLLGSVHCEWCKVFIMLALNVTCSVY